MGRSNLPFPAAPQYGRREYVKPDPIDGPAEAFGSQAVPAVELDDPVGQCHSLVLGQAPVASSRPGPGVPPPLPPATAVKPSSVP